MIVLVLNLPFKALLRKNAFWAAALFTTLQVTAALGLQGVAVGDHSEVFAGFLRLNFWVDNLTNVMLLCGGLVGLVVVLVERYLSRHPVPPETVRIRDARAHSRDPLA